MLCGKQCGSWTAGFFRSQPTWIYTLFNRIYIWFHTVFNIVYTCTCVLFKHSEGLAKLVLRALFYFLWTSIHLMAIYLSLGKYQLLLSLVLNLFFSNFFYTYSGHKTQSHNYLYSLSYTLSHQQAANAQTSQPHKTGKDQGFLERGFIC